jgi:folate-binding protein YgfZ
MDPSASGQIRLGTRAVSGDSDVATPATGYSALRTGAMLIDRSARSRMSLSGPKAAEVLSGLVTNDVLSLTPGHGQYAAALTAKGRILADVRVFARDDARGFLIDVPERAADGWWAMVRKYVNPRLARYTNVSESLSDLGVFGVHARALVATVTGADQQVLEGLVPYAHREAPVDGEPVLVARVPDLGLEGYEVFASPDAAGQLRRRLAAAGAVVADRGAFDIARIEAGRPEWGIDIDDTTLAQEANLDELHAISYTKGCYTGQETVARVHFRGHVNRQLRGLRFEVGPLPPTGSELQDDGGRVVGDVRSVAVSPRLGSIALAMVRREVPPDAVLCATWSAGRASATVVALPFPI